MNVGGMLVAGQRVAYQNGVAALGVERAIGLIGDLERGKLDAGIEPQRLVGAELHDQRTRIVGLAGTASRIAGNRLAVSRIEPGAHLGHLSSPRRHGGIAADGATGKNSSSANRLDRPPLAPVNVFFAFMAFRSYQ